MAIRQYPSSLKGDDTRRRCRNDQLIGDDGDDELSAAKGMTLSSGRG
jgi:hypothetical protein